MKKTTLITNHSLCTMASPSFLVLLVLTSLIAWAILLSEEKKEGEERRPQNLNTIRLFTCLKIETGDAVKRKQPSRT